MSTIAAIITAPGNAAVSIIKISGDEAWEIAEKLRHCKRSEAISQHIEILTSPAKQAPQDDVKENQLQHRRVEITWINDGKNKIDQVLILPFKAPHSYTGEDLIEIHSHGGTWITEKILKLVLEAGATLAKPGEFTERAFLNHKLDLSQAEAILDIIQARSGKASENAIKLYQGYLGNAIREMRVSLLNLLGELTACIDFPDEVPDYDRENYKQQTNSAINKIDELLAGEEEGHILREGYKVAIVGNPNVGKSTLLNTLLKKERAIVTDIPGTTRDLIEESYSIKGLPIILLDTAGIRESEDQVERIGIERSHRAIEEADLVILLDDLSSTSHADRSMLNAIENKNHIKVGTKLDLAESSVQAGMDLSISSKSGTNIEELKELIYSRIVHGKSDNQVKINHRQADLLRKARNLLKHSAESTHLAIDFWTIDLRGAIAALGEITGETLTEELLDNIFSRFCIGK